MLDGADGAKAFDDLWPAFHQSDVHASPIMADFDYDGILDILLATSNGEVLVVKDTVRLPFCIAGPPFAMRGCDDIKELAALQDV